MRRVVPVDGLPQPQRTWAWLAIILGISLAVLDGSIANVALPTIAEHFDADPSLAIWIVNGYQLAVAISLLPMASLGGIYGYRRVYLAGITVFTLASLVCVVSTSLPMLAAARIAQGFGAAGLMSLNVALLRYIVPRAGFGMALGLNMLIVSTAATVGPTLGGAILAVAEWPLLFVLNLPLGVAAVATGFFALPESERSERRFDWLSALLSALTVGLLITTISSIGHAVPVPVIVAGAVGFAVAGWLLYRREAGMADPLLPVDLLRIPVFTLSVCTSVVSFIAQMMAFVALPFMLQSLYGFAPLEVGLLMMPWPLANALAALMAGRLSDRYSPALLGSAGLALLSASLALLAGLPAEPQVADIVWRMALCGIGFGFFQAPNNHTLVTSAPRRRAGGASGMLSTARVTGQSIGAAMVALILGLFGLGAAPLALWVATGVAALGALVSITRVGMFNRPDAAGGPEGAE